MLICAATLLKYNDMNLLIVFRLHVSKNARYARLLSSLVSSIILGLGVVVFISALDFSLQVALMLSDMCKYLVCHDRSLTESTLTSVDEVFVLACNGGSRNGISEGAELLSYFYHHVYSLQDFRFRSRICIWHNVQPLCQIILGYLEWIYRTRRNREPAIFSVYTMFEQYSRNCRYAPAGPI
jgi:hypothetical protein